MNAAPKATHLYPYHKQHAKLITFAGFQMPLWYKGIIPEHLAVRNNVGIFDITHMGRATITGPKAQAFLNHITTNDVTALTPLTAQYTTMCNHNGGIKDDFILSQLEPNKYFAVYNAANRQKDYTWLEENAKPFNVTVEDVSDRIAMFAVQGPKAEDTVQKIADADLTKIERFKCGWTKLADKKTFLSRTGYTGEDGFEIFIWDTPLANPENATAVWNAILKAGEEHKIEPCGLGARDTLRLESGMCLYGNDIDETTTPLEASLSFVVKLKKETFVGKETLAKQKAEGTKRKRVGLRMLEKGPNPRPKQEVWKGNQKVGYTTSGTFSPLLECGIAMAYLSIEHAVEGETVYVKVRDRLQKAQIAKFPLYDTAKYGYMRQE
jgi:aminomethyltransferase